MTDPKREAVARNDDLIAVPREVLAAANYIIRKGAHADSKTAVALRKYALGPAILALGSADGDEAEDALSIYRALQSVQPVYYASAIRVTTDVPFSWYVIGPDGEVAYCQTEDGQRHAEMIAAALNDRVAMCALSTLDAREGG